MEKQIKLKRTLLISKITLTLSSLFLFLVWLMFMTNNFYPKSNDSIISKIMDISIQIMIWPITSIILFIFIMPVWVTNKKKILLVFLGIASTIAIICLLFVFGLNINKFWVIWLIAHLFTIGSIIFVISVYFFNSGLLFLENKQTKDNIITNSSKK
ncbi:hypothetical protein [Spiroplasma endosymbiont of Virgichneumon dumeticola]|uniref:hypothetical protein n=1 Tax=Spiroplasma endosymbiont of Virgichneumon dumeticola TaxID=3139323 RepID=UPI0035C90575